MPHRNRLAVRREMRTQGGFSFDFLVTNLSPGSAMAGAGPTPVDVQGTGFPIGATVYVDNVAITTAYSTPLLLQFVMPGTVTAVPGYKVVQVRLSGQISNTTLFGVIFPVPVLTTASFLAPTLSVTGSNVFAVGTHAQIDGSLVLPFTWTSPTTGTIEIPQSVIDVPGAHTVRLFNDAPGGGFSTSKSFDVKYQPAALLSLSQIRQFTGRDAGPFTIFGDTNPSASVFYSVSVVKVDGTAITSTTLATDRIECTIPGALLMTPGMHAVTVTNPTTGGGGGTSNALDFLSFSPDFDALSITEVPQYFDGFDVTGHVDYIDANFVATFGGVDQPTEILDANNFIVHMTSAAIGVAGVTTVRLRDTLSSAVTNAKTVTVTAWDPNQITAGLRLWFNGTSLVDDGGGRAQAWNDLSGGGRHITQPVAGKRPLIVAASTPLNGQPAARFDNVRQDNFTTGLSWLVVGAAGIINKAAYNIWIVAQNTLTGTGQAVMGDGPGYIAVSVTATAPERLQELDDSGGAVNAIVPFVWSGGARFAFRGRKDSTNVYARVNRNAEVSIPLFGNPTAFAPTAVIIGSKAVGSGFWKGDIGEGIVADRDLNTTYKALIDNMLSTKYNLPFSTPGTAPRITSVTPNTAQRYDLPFDFIVENVSGIGTYTTLSTVNVGGTPLATEYISSTQLRARMPNTRLWVAGGLAISVSDTTGISAPTGITVFDTPPAPGPNLYTSSVASTIQFNNDLVGVVFGGLNFSPAAVIYANGIACATVRDSAAQLTATIPSAALYSLPGAIITVHDGADVSNPLEITLTAWSPASIIGVSMWLRADSVVLGAGTDVAQWTDKLGFGRHQTQATVSKRPQLVASDANLNGAPSLSFDGVDDYFTGVGLSSLFTQALAHATILIVFRPRTITGASPITNPALNNYLVGASTNIGFSLRNTPIAYAFVNDGAVQVATNPTVAPLAKACAVLVANAGSVNVTINGVLGTPDTFALLTLGAQVFGIGSVAPYTASFFDGNIPEIVALNLPATAQDLICWPNYCRARYATP